MGADWFQGLSFDGIWWRGFDWGAAAGMAVVLWGWGCVWLSQWIEARGKR